MSLPPKDSPPVSTAGDGQADRLASGVWKVVCVAAIGSFMAQLDATVVNVSLASLAADLHVSLSAIQWVTSGYLLALALTLPLNGWLVDRIGAKALYLWCFAAFTLSSTLCGLAWSANSLVAFRIVQGMSGGLLAPMAQMMIARAAGKQMAQVISVAALPVLLAPLLGPVVAGAIVQFASWRWLFLINLPVGVLALALAAAFLSDDRQETRPRGLDLFGLTLLSPGLVLFLYGSDHLGERVGVVALAVSVVMFALFCRMAQAKGDAALIDLRLLKGKVFSTSIATMFMVNGVSFAGQMLIPVYLVRACGLSPGRTGCLLAPLGLGMMCTYPFMGRLTKRFGIRKLAACGALTALAGTLPLVFLSRHGLVVSVLAASLFIRGVGVSAIGIPSIASGYASVARQDLPMATTAMNIVQRLGGPTLTTLCATFLGWRLSGAPDTATTSGAFVAAFSLLCALHALLFLVTLRLPWMVPHSGAALQSSAADSRPA
ncbi:DHA2 family efflux MFS transporter permease subunit [Burkholderia sp. MSMB1498]|uniref:DHA2 family efflux MFS transporter permease subunit n=1 Tax=Burkholderia sp. MSMB1498 TaxID=1637842 RepID=UPI000755AE7A|nr:DHA2 family efflux MFS transporter permease subunit [Burkholderia sp. MSMB1498]KVK83546.1 disulfide bond formation protein DsbA [Burkholderia sp. MSMB1498]